MHENKRAVLQQMQVSASTSTSANTNELTSE